MYMYVQEPEETRRGHWKSYPLELESQAVVNYHVGARNLTWVLTRTVSTLSHQAISPAPEKLLL